MTEQETLSESARDIKEIKDMIRQLRTDVAYLYGLMEGMFEKSKASDGTDAMQNVLNMNTELMKSLFKDKDFEGKDQVFEIFDNLKSLTGGK